ncbi:hypothetical protein F5Y19DRAFT_488684 [Xylariaceae sp. FL1651]|nr:hypothetical protein F5Y19DRAFT_488684 [Xylariaceae sp. FL1651]
MGEQAGDGESQHSQSIKRHSADVPIPSVEEALPADKAKKPFSTVFKRFKSHTKKHEAKKAAWDGDDGVFTPTWTNRPAHAESVKSPRTPASSGSKTLAEPRRPSAQASKPRVLKTRESNPRVLQEQLGLQAMAPLQNCGNCGNWFTESHNTKLACTWHPGRVHFEDAEYIAYVPTPVHWEQRYLPNRFRWNCCGEVVGTTSGCVSYKHVPKPYTPAPPPEPKTHGRKQRKQPLPLPY